MADPAKAFYDIKSPEVQIASGVLFQTCIFILALSRLIVDFVIKCDIIKVSIDRNLWERY